MKEACQGFFRCNTNQLCMSAQVIAQKMDVSRNPGVGSLTTSSHATKKGLTLSLSAAKKSTAKAPAEPLPGL
jgi:hypothetical protein